jgi:hypothetical protein
MAAVKQHTAYMAGAADGFEWGYAGLGLHAATGGLLIGTIWLVLTALGVLGLLRDPGTRRPAGLLLGLVAVPLIVLSLAAQNATLPRYALPILALSSGAVVAGARTIVGSRPWGLASVGAMVIGLVVVTVPVLRIYRTEPSPVVAAFGRLGGSPEIRAVAVDRRLVAFATLEQALGRLRQQVVWDYQVELGMVESPFRPDLAAIAVGSTPPWVVDEANVTSLSCDRPLLRRIVSPRFLELTLIEGCGLARPDHPSVRPEDIRPGAVIPARTQSGD